MGRSTTIVYQTDTSSSSTPPATNSETPFISGGGKVSAWVAFLTPWVALLCELFLGDREESFLRF